MCSAGVFIYQHIHMPCVFACECVYQHIAGGPTKPATARHGTEWDGMRWDGMGSGPGPASQPGVAVPPFPFALLPSHFRVASNRFLIIPCTAPVGQVGVSNVKGTFVG